MENYTPGITPGSTPPSAKAVFNTICGIVAIIVMISVVVHAADKPDSLMSKWFTPNLSKTIVIDNLGTNVYVSEVLGAMASSSACEGITVVTTDSPNYSEMIEKGGTPWRLVTSERGVAKIHWILREHKRLLDGESSIEGSAKAICNSINGIGAEIK